ncbi:MAG TPA: class I SAM-dependent methyltransferase [Solirubrobacteraceae bacterium]
MTTWGLGDYPRMAEKLRPAAEAVVAAARIKGGHRVVDLACGDGNAALIAAGHGARVVGVDFEPALLARAAARAGGADVEWREADVAATGLADGAFQAVLSVFGVMYAPDHEAAARELARLCAPGGRVVLAAWKPGGLMPAMGGALAPFLPPPPAGSGPPSRWGDAEAATELLGGAGLRVTATHQGTITLSFAAPTEAVAFLVATAGHVLAERDALRDRDEWEPMLAALHGLVAERDASPEEETVLGLDYVVVAASPAD